MEYLSAYELKDALAAYGTSIGIAADSGSVPSNSILVGKTSAIADEMPTDNQYRVVAEESGNIYVLASNYYGYRAALAFLKREFASHGGIFVGTYTGDATTSLMSASNGAIRTMFYNVYGWNNWKDANKNEVTGTQAPALTLRQDLQRDLLSAYAPDVIGFQEYNKDTYHQSFTQILNDLGYTELAVTVPDRGGSARANHTPLFYKADRVKPVDNAKGFVWYDCTDNQGNWSYSKSVTWAVFEEIATGNQFAVFNTHFMQWYDSNSDSDDIDAGESAEQRKNNAMALLNVISEVAKQYSNIPMIVGGDLNYAVTTADAHTALVDGGLTYLPNSGNSYHGFYTYDAVKKIYDMDSTTIPSPYTLDRIFLGGNTQSIEYSHALVLDDTANRASDHSPTLVDIIFRAS